MDIKAEEDGDWTVLSSHELDLVVRVDYVRCSSPVQWINPLGEWSSTPWQTADVRHINAEQLLGMVSELVSEEI